MVMNIKIQFSYSLVCAVFKYQYSHIQLTPWNSCGTVALFGSFFSFLAPTGTFCMDRQKKKKLTHIQFTNYIYFAYKIPEL